MIKKQDLLQDSSNPHRRTFSNNFETIKGVRSGHRRTVSNTASDFSALQIPSIPENPEKIQTSLPPNASTKKQAKNSRFSNFLDSSLTFFQQESDFHNLPPNFDATSLKKQRDSLLINQKDLKFHNENLKNECEEHKSTLNGLEKNRIAFEASISALHQYYSQLEKALSKGTLELSLQKKQNEDLSSLILHQESETSRTSPFSDNSKTSSKKHSSSSKKQVEKPTPKPITYKPLSQRGLRNSRDSHKIS